MVDLYKEITDSGVGDTIYTAPNNSKKNVAVFSSPEVEQKAQNKLPSSRKSSSRSRKSSSRKSNPPPAPEPTPQPSVSDLAKSNNENNPKSTSYISPQQKLSNALRSGTAGDTLRASQVLVRQGYTATIDRPEFSQKYKQENIDRNEDRFSQFVTNNNSNIPYDPKGQIVPRQATLSETSSFTSFSNAYPIDMKSTNKLLSEYNYKDQSMKKEYVPYFNMSASEISPINIDSKRMINSYNISSEYTPKISSSRDLLNISKLKEQSQDISLGQEAIKQYKKKTFSGIVFGTTLAGTSTLIGSGKGALGTVEFFSPYSIQQRKFQIPILTPARDMVLSLNQLPAYAKKEPFEFSGLLVGGYATGKIINPYIPKLKQGTTIIELEGKTQEYSIIRSVAIEQGDKSFILGSTKRKYTSDVSFSSDNIPKKYTITGSGEFKRGLIVTDAPTKGVRQNPIDKLFFSNPDPYIVSNPLDFKNTNIFVGEVPSKNTFRVFSKSPNIVNEISNMKIGGKASEGLRISTPTETKMIRYNLRSIGVDLLDNPSRARNFIPIGQNIIRSTKGVKSKYNFGFDKKTKFLDETGTNIVLDVAKNSRKLSQSAFINKPLEYYGTEAGKSSGKLFQFKRKSLATGSGQSFVSGSFARMPELSRNYKYGKQKFVLNKEPKDLDIHIEGSPEVVQNIADITFNKLKYKGYDVRQTGEGGTVKNAIEIKVNGKYEKAVEFLGEGTIPEGEVPPDMVLGFKKEGSKVKTSGVTRTTLSEELRGTYQGLARLRRLDSGKIDIYPREGRLKDVASVSISARTLQESLPFGKNRYNLIRNIKKFESFYPDEVVREQVKLPESKIVADFRVSTWKSKYYDFGKPTINLWTKKKEIYESSKYKMVEPSRIVSTISVSSSSRVRSSSKSYIPSISLSSSRISSKSASNSVSRSSSKIPSISKSLSKSLSLSPSSSRSPSFSPSSSKSPSNSKSPSPSRSISISKPPSIISKSIIPSKSLNTKSPFNFKFKQSKFSQKSTKKNEKLRILPSLRNVFEYEASSGKEAIMPIRTKKVKRDFENQLYGYDIFGVNSIPVRQKQKI